jgi:predicted metal-binding membrane protein
MALRRDQSVVTVGLALVVIAAWAWTLGNTGTMGTMGSMATTPTAWSASHAALMVLMWWVMMVAMMVPSAAPLVLLATALHRRKAEPGRPALMAGLMTVGYLAAWGAFSLAATLAQWGLEQSWMMSPHTMAAGPAVAGAILVAAGVYQVTPLKRACLRHCRAPVGFITEHWQPGGLGAFRLGVAHGAYCVGCCWFLMGLLFVGGVMNPFWIGGIALYVLLEKFAPRGLLLSRATGLMLAVSGVLVLARIV